MRSLRSFHDWLIESLKDTKEAEAYRRPVTAEELASKFANGTLNC